MPNAEPVLDRLDRAEPAALERLRAYLRIPSVSAQPAHAEDCRQAAEWTAAHLRESGFSARLVETGGHPVVLAHHAGPGGQVPHLLYYGHYDVQPAEPLDLWTSPAFEPAVLDGPRGPRIVARGAVDDKGQVSMWLEALRAWHDAAGGPPCAITAVIEGEEEVGSAHLHDFLEAEAASLAADVAIVSDTAMWNVDTPAITTRLRGLVYVQLVLRAASRDLHSGLYGGSAQNPINLLTAALGGLHDATGQVAIPGFYDGVAPLDPSQAAAWDALRFSEAEFLGGIGLRDPAGEQGVAPLERMWARPTADLNGIWGGYQGDGPKTVIPAEAGAKLSFRLVPGQDPAQVLSAFETWVRGRLPAGADLRLTCFGAEPAIEVPSASRFVDAARRALRAEYGRDAVLIGSGGSIPVVASLKSALGIDSLLMGFGLDDDQVHSPNEKFELVCWRHGMRAHARLLAELA